MQYKGILSRSPINTLPIEENTALPVSSKKNRGEQGGQDIRCVCFASGTVDFGACMCLPPKVCFLISWGQGHLYLNEWSAFVEGWCDWPTLAVVQQQLMDIFCFIRGLLCWLPLVYYQLPFLYQLSPKDNRSKLICDSIESLQYLKVLILRTILGY